MWAQVILEALTAAPIIIRAIERMRPGSGRGAEKLGEAMVAQRAAEPPATETEALTAARAAMLSAQVQYANALAAAREPSA